MIAWTEPDLPVEDSPEEREGQRRMLRGVGLPVAARRIIAGVVVTAALLACAQFAGVGPLPARYNSVTAGMAFGTLFGALLLWNRGRRPQE